MAASERMHNFSKVSCLSYDNLGKNDGRVKPLSWPFILQNLREIEASFDGQISLKLSTFLEQTAPLLEGKRTVVTWTNQKAARSEDQGPGNEVESRTGFEMRNCGLRSEI